jgi:hypothetical protein
LKGKYFVLHLYGQKNKQMTTTTQHDCLADIKWANKKLAEAKKELKVAKLRLEIYNTLIAMDCSDSFAKHVTEYFNFDKVLNSNEFTDAEKQTIQALKDKHQSL